MMQQPQPQSESWGSENSVPCVPCPACNGTGVLQLAPVPPPLLLGDEGRVCSSCGQRFPNRGYCGHSMHNIYGGPDLWYCSPNCYVEATGDTRPWTEPRAPEMRVLILSLPR